MAQFVLSADSTLAGAVPWGWRDIARTILLSVVSLMVLLVFLIVTIAVRQLMGTSDDLIVLSGSIEIGFYAIILLAIYWTTVRRYRSPWAALGVRPVPWGWLALAPLLVAGILTVGGALAVAISELQGQQFVNPQVHDITQGQQLTPTHLIMLLLGTAVMAPIVEELFFRGMLYPLLRRRLPVWLAVVANAVIFAALHFIPILLPILFVMGLLLSFVRARTNSVVPCILIHAINNTIFVLGIYATFGR
ncbi:MAG TPA: type II CAAX endopeptidase family protein [Roseiflexaceae bacterium]|nr:type II CAAX endopeptidase family protein [Roseiflexaceae bacterium]